MGWEGIVGHERVVATLRQSVDQGRVAHALLFTGPPGVGKGTLAGRLVQARLCEGVNVPCGACRSCSAYERGAHPDIHVVGAEGASIGIRQVREAQHQAALRPYWGMGRVIWVDPAERLTPQAQNSLLKLLEEPPQGVHIVLLAAGSGAILPTVRSRCQVFALRPVPERTLEEALEAQGLSAAEASLLARLACGRPGAALAAGSDDLLARRETVAGWLHDLRDRPEAWFTVGAALEDRKDELLPWLDMMAIWLRDLLLCSLGRAASAVNADRSAELTKMASTCRPSGLLSAIAGVEQAQAGLRGPANVRLAIDAMLIQVQRGLADDSSRRRAV